MKHKLMHLFLFLTCALQVMIPLNAGFLSRFFNLNTTPAPSAPIKETLAPAQPGTQATSAALHNVTSKSVGQEEIGAAVQAAAEGVPQVQEDGPGFVDMLKRGWGEVQGFGALMWGGIKSAAWSTRAFHFDKPRTWEGFNKKRAALTVGTTVATALAAKGYYDLTSIDAILGASEVETAAGNNFLFGSWKYSTINFATPHEINEHADEVKRALWHDVKNERSRIHITNAAGARIIPQNVTKLDLLTALRREQEQLCGYLNTISRLTDVPLRILELVQEKRGQDVAGDSYTWYQDAALHNTCVEYLSQLTTDNLSGPDGFGATLLNERCNSWSSWAKRVIFVPSFGESWRVWNWRPGLWYGRASRLYWKVYLRYLRTCTLYNLVSADRTVVDVQRPTLERLQTLVQEMANNQPGAYNDHTNKSAQITRLTHAREMLRALRGIYRENSALGTIENQFNEINVHLLTASRQPTPNDADGLTLQNIAQRLHELIEQLRNQH